MRICVAATPDVAIPTLDYLLHSDHELISVITQPDRPAGRGRELQSTPVAQWASVNNILIHKCNSDDEVASALENIDLVIAIGYGRILAPYVLQIPRYGFINLHFSLLPSYRGAAPAQRALLAGEVKTGVTVFKLDAGMDTGPIYRSQVVDIAQTWNTGDLLKVLSEIGSDIVSATIDDILAGVLPVAQPGAGISFAPKILRDETWIDWSQSAEKINNHVRAFTPHPGALTKFRGQIFKIINIGYAEEEIMLKAGELTLLNKKVYVGCDDGQIVNLISVTPSGGKPMSACDWANGARLVLGEKFG